ncbi:YgdI/YgdR family lipoprotein [Alcanivorax sp. S6407]|uniref:YgdI/YgdR family lipoprotein n=1 Tax=Alcanivorax sp. S6407 TaxID=2926424 RepID=UPI001FF17167|nr:YgdI/YgdR family lipoprotein [Alcanivorax sp. S6407]MCK0152569.1 YgdI/YgdR family lipoprotein [Alcanivorax sp. S6407]
MRHFLVLSLLALAGCQSAVPAGDASSGLYVYTDAQGNLVTMERPAERKSAPPAKLPESTSSPEADASSPQAMDNIEDYRPSGEVDQELEDRENQRFVTYVDETGQLVSRPIDMGAERAAAASAPPAYEAVPSGGFMETYRALRADCCLHMLESAQQLEPGSEKLVTFDEDSLQMAGENGYRASVFRLDQGLSSVTLNAFLKKAGYLAVELLWLDAEGSPVMLVDQPFSRKYPETWYRYGYLQGTLEREAGQQYLVVFLPYSEEQPGTDGLLKVTQGELVLMGK